MKLFTNHAPDLPRWLMAASLISVSLGKRVRIAGNSEAQANMRIADAARRDVSELLESLGTSKEGLSAEEATGRLDQYGPNEVAHERPPRWYIQFPLAFKNTFIILLIALALLSYATGDSAATVIISLMVLISGLLRFFQEYRSTQAAEKLKAMVSTTATVSRINAADDIPSQIAKAFDLPPARREAKAEVPIKLLVPGDVVHLCGGRYDSGRCPSDWVQRPVHQPGCLDRRVDSCGKT